MFSTRGVARLLTASFARVGVTVIADWLVACTSFDPQAEKQFRSVLLSNPAARLGAALDQAMWSIPGLELEGVIPMIARTQTFLLESSSPRVWRV